MAAKRKRGRPKGSGSLKTPEVLDAIVEWIAQGKPLRELCRAEGMPSRATVDRWRTEDADFASRVARARETGFDVLAEECLEIADFGLNDSYEDDEGRTRTNVDVIQRSRLRVDTRLKLLACWDPRRYGNKQQVEHEGGVVLRVVTGVPRDEDD